MNSNKTFLSRFLLTTILLCSGGAVLADCPPTLQAGKACQITVEKVSGSTKFTWGYLQLFQIHLRKLDTANQREYLGCTTNKNNVDCADVEGGLLGAPVKGLKKVEALNYLVEKTDWDRAPKAGEQTFLALFNEAYAKVLLEDPANAAQIQISFAEVLAPTEACTDPGSYIQPCYSRAVCTQYGGCSKSKFSCLKCPPAP